MKQELEAYFSQLETTVNTCFCDLCWPIKTLFPNKKAVAVYLLKDYNYIGFPGFYTNLPSDLKSAVLSTKSARHTFGDLLGEI